MQLKGVGGRSYMLSYGLQITVRLVTSKLAFFLIWLAVSVRYIEEVMSEALILLLAPCRAGKKVECKRAGFCNPIFGATSRVIRK